MAIFLLVVVIALALCGKAFRFERNCQITIGQQAPVGQAWVGAGGDVLGVTGLSRQPVRS